MQVPPNEKAQPVGWAFSMGLTVETHIVTVYHFDSDSTDVWVTQITTGPYSECLGVILGADAAILKALSSVIKEVATRPHF